MPVIWFLKKTKQTKRNNNKNPDCNIVILGCEYPSVPDFKLSTVGHSNWLKKKKKSLNV